MRSSLSAKLFGLIFASCFIIILISFVLINNYSSNFYQHEQKNIMEKYVRKVRLMKQLRPSNFGGRLNRWGTNTIIFDKDQQLTYYDAGMFNHTPQYEELINMIENSNFTVDDNIFYGVTNNFFGDHEQYYVYGEKPLKGGCTIVTFVLFDSINESVGIIKKGFVFIMLIGLITASIAAFILSRNIVKPVLRLNKIATEMGKLNFSLRYDEVRKDEIGQLGDTLNNITKKLETTINQLQRELSKEKNMDNLRKQFVAQVSHELQTPLSIINGYIDGLRDGIVEEGQEQEYYYDVIKDETTKMSKMVRDLLDLSQLESGAFNIDKQKIDLGYVLYEIYNKYIEIMKKANLEFQQDGIKYGLFVSGDAVRIEQIITNLLNNAIKNTDRGGIVTIRVEPNKDDIKVEVINQGDNISEQDLELIWESFYKSKDTDSKKGIGLGLAITKNLVKLHGGRYYVKNIKDGVCFGVDIPRVKGEIK